MSATVPVAWPPWKKLALWGRYKRSYLEWAWAAPRGRLLPLYRTAVGVAVSLVVWLPADMTSLEGICPPTRADSDAPASLTSLHRETPSSTLA